MSYLANLTLRLATAVASLPEDLLTRHTAFIIGAQAGDGGFAGRKGSGDLYYTSFALRALALLSRLDDATAERVTEFLKSRFSHKLPGIDFISLLASAVVVEAASGHNLFDDLGIDPQQTAKNFFAPLRRPDGGYAKTPRSGTGSTYHTFLVAACLEMLGMEPDEPQQMIEMIRRRQRADGGFVEIDPMRHSGTNPTAAAIGLLKMLGGLEKETARAAAGFLAGAQTPEGGLRANTRIPVADLLSTFTGLVALEDLDALDGIDTAAAEQFVRSLDRPDGGFQAGTWDDDADVEYTFYGVGALGLLSNL